MTRPCQACKSKSLVCSWTRIQHTSSGPGQPTQCQQQEPTTDALASSTTENSPLPSMSTDIVVPHEAPQLQAPENQAPTPISKSSSFTLENIQVPFLINFINPENGTFADIFGYSSKAPEILQSRAESVSSTRRSLDYSVEQLCKSYPNLTSWIV